MNTPMEEGELSPSPSPPISTTPPMTKPLIVQARTPAKTNTKSVEEETDPELLALYNNAVKTMPNKGTLKNDCIASSKDMLVQKEISVGNTNTGVEKEPFPSYFYSENLTAVLNRPENQIINIATKNNSISKRAFGSVSDASTRKRKAISPTKISSSNMEPLGKHRNLDIPRHDKAQHSRVIPPIAEKTLNGSKFTFSTSNGTPVGIKTNYFASKNTPLISMPTPLISTASPSTSKAAPLVSKTTPGVSKTFAKQKVVLQPPKISKSLQKKLNDYFNLGRDFLHNGRSFRGVQVGNHNLVFDTLFERVEEKLKDVRDKHFKAALEWKIAKNILNTQKIRENEVKKKFKDASEKSKALSLEFMLENPSLDNPKCKNLRADLNIILKLKEECTKEVFEHFCRSEQLLPEITKLTDLFEDMKAWKDEKEKYDKECQMTLLKDLGLRENSEVQSEWSDMSICSNEVHSLVQTPVGSSHQREHSMAGDVSIGGELFRIDTPPPAPSSLNDKRKETVVENDRSRRSSMNRYATPSRSHSGQHQKNNSSIRDSSYNGMDYEDNPADLFLGNNHDDFRSGNISCKGNSSVLNESAHNIRSNNGITRENESSRRAPIIKSVASSWINMSTMKKQRNDIYCGDRHQNETPVQNSKFRDHHNSNEMLRETSAVKDNSCGNRKNNALDVLDETFKKISGQANIMESTMVAVQAAPQFLPTTNLMPQRHSLITQSNRLLPSANLLYQNFCKPPPNFAEEIDPYGIEIVQEQVPQRQEIFEPIVQIEPCYYEKFGTCHDESCEYSHAGDYPNNHRFASNIIV
uniref:C3H1-type domain-containing protein n=1 Tax=Rhabditophanes sp. KR3021 TaxID=114890 RepID=A0AC35TPG8_9BILA